MHKLWDGAEPHTVTPECEMAGSAYSSSLGAMAHWQHMQRFPLLLRAAAVAISVCSGPST